MIPRGTIAVPGDKSISHRALILGALSSGRSRIRNLLRSADVASTAGVLASLGVTIEQVGDDSVVHGRGLRGLTQASSSLDCGNSGTTTRLMAGVVAGHPFSTTFVGDASLSRRPMHRLAAPLEKMGARFQFANHDGLPMTVVGGSLASIGWNSTTASAQIKSAILLAGAVAQIPVSVTEPQRSRDHTERMLAARGVDVLVDGLSVSIGVVPRMTATETRVPGDPSSAAFFVALAALIPGSAIDLPNVCLNPTRTGFLSMVQRMGAIVRQYDVAIDGGEPVGRIEATGAGRLRAISIGAAEIPAVIDEIPMFACTATRAEGETVVTGAAELRSKESDRISAVVRNLRAIGADADELPDGMVIRGSDRPLAGRIDTHGDHRLAMAFGILAAVPGNDIHLDDPECVAVSYPSFWTELSRVTA